MSDLLPASSGVTASEVALEFEPLPDEQVISGEVSTGYVELGEAGGVSFGLWEHSAGISTDVEADEVFVVVAGRGKVEIAQSEGEPAIVIPLEPGTIARLAAGSHTVWTIESPLRKVYFSA